MIRVPPGEYLIVPESGLQFSPFDSAQRQRLMARRAAGPGSATTFDGSPHGGLPFARVLYIVRNYAILSYILHMRISRL